MTKDFDAAMVGAAGIDTNIYLYGREIDFEVEANFSDNKDYIGCAGGYCSRLFNTLEKRTAFIGAFGEDYHGEYIRREFAKEGIDLSAIFTDPEGTLRSVNFMFPDGRRKNFYDGQGSSAIRADMTASRKVLERARLAHFSVVSCDLQDIVDPADEYRRDFAEAADVLFFSASNFDDPTPLIERFLESDPHKIVVTGMGSRGCALGTKDGVRFYKPVDMEIPVIDTNGAGDSLAVGFLTSYCFDGYSLEDSILRGQIVARHTCTLKADSSRFIKPRELDERFRKMKA
jgi:sugar/nucleoside kinase (ribokinase family)